jgi:hypothetical protein
LDERPAHRNSALLCRGSRAASKASVERLYAEAARVGRKAAFAPVLFRSPLSVSGRFVTALCASDVDILSVRGIAKTRVCTDPAAISMNELQRISTKPMKLAVTALTTELREQIIVDLQRISP